MTSTNQLDAPAPQSTAAASRKYQLARKKAMLAEWVARLNQLRSNRAYRAIERRINRMLREVDREETSGVNSSRLDEQVDQWLAANAGKIGGPEQEQDPTRPHPPGWHGEALTQKVAGELAALRERKAAGR